MEAEGDQVAYLNIGIGLNVNNMPEPEALIAISMKKLLGKTTPRREVLTAFLDVFEKRMSAFEPDGVIEQWISNNVTIGQNVRVLTIKDRVDGTAVDIDPFGGLVLELADGSRRTVMVGDCFHR
jgi:BirA family biotin operon repressor/biotin-[acetyl-CoA-carboxylase] ligase